jgi:hypothetical protein
MRPDDPPRWTRGRLMYLAVGVIISAVGVILILTSL